MTKEYDNNHKACPKCGNTELMNTYVDYISGKDLNKAECSCGWRGIIDECVPVKERKMEPLKIKWEISPSREYVLTPEEEDEVIEELRSKLGFDTLVKE